MELGHDRPFEVNHLVDYFLGRWWRMAYDVFTLAYLGGVLVSYWTDRSPAGCIVLVQTGLFVLAFLFAPDHGILRRHSFMPR